MNSELKPRLLKLGYLSKIQRQSGKNKKQNSGCSGVFLFLIKETLMKIYLLFFGYKRFNSFDEREGLTPRIVLRKDVTFSMEKKEIQAGLSLELHGVRFPASHHKTLQRNIFVSHSLSPWTPSSLSQLPHELSFSVRTEMSANTDKTLKPKKAGL